MKNLLAPVRAALLLVCLGWCALPAQAQVLNDTGQTQCNSARSDGYAADVCGQVTSGRIYQDGNTGRDNLAVMSLLTKAGGGAAGFDFTRICWNGSPEGTTTGPNQCNGPLVANTGGNPSTTPATDWACTRDNVTGAVWSLQSQGPMTWAAAVAANANDNANTRCGLNDWRLPNRRELFGIVHMGATAAPTIDASYFPLTSPNDYWTADTSVANGLSAWLVRFSDGSQFLWDKSSDTFFGSPFLVRLVSSPPSEFVFSVNTNGTVTQSGTGLVWDRCVLGRSGVGCDGTSERHGWLQALDTVQQRNASGHLGFNNWRLPNVKELESLVKIDQPYPWVDANAFPNSETSWTSTTLPLRISAAFTVGGSTSSVEKPAFSYLNFNAGGSGFDALELSAVRLVREVNLYPPGACGSAAVSSPPVTTAPSVNLCRLGTASTVTESASNFTWTCNGLNGAGASPVCTAGRGYTVSASAGAGGSVSPSSQVVAHGATASVAVTANSGFGASASGCSGSLSGSSYTTGTITADCSVAATFVDNLPDGFSFAGGTGSFSSGLGAVLTSNSITVQGLGGATPISISDGGQYSINGGSFTSSAGTVSNGNTVVMRHTASASPNTGTNTRLTIGSFSTSFITTTAPATAPGLNDTGQTSCYDASNAAVVCSDITASNTSTRPHQDARYGRDAAFAAGQFTKTGGGAAGFDFTRICWNGADEGTTTGPNQCTGTLVANTTDTPSGTPATDWACTRDNVTGAVWSLQSQQATWNTATEANYPDAGHNTNSRCGFTDWRLPNRRELFGIVHMGATAAPTIDASYFPSTQTSSYLTSDSYAPLPALAWVVDFFDGDANAFDGANTNWVRLVRGGQPAFTFTPNANGTVTQSGTDLVWDRCVRGLSGSTCAGTPTIYTWAQALAEVTARNAANHLGFSDWRLPNVKELESLIKIDSTTAPAIDTTAFPNTPTGLSGPHWTSSSSVLNPASAWIVYFNDGSAIAVRKTNAYWVRLVRSGQSFSSFDAFPPISGACGSAHASSSPFAAPPPSADLCSPGTVTGFASTASAYTWTCNGPNGGTASPTCGAGRGYTVTASVAGANGSISPSGAQVVAYNATPSFTVSANLGYAADMAAGGSHCGGTLSGTTFTTSAVTADCTVAASFSGNDATPDTFSFTPLTGAAQGSAQTASFTVAGLTTGAAISITGVGSEYRITRGNAVGSFTNANGTVLNGDIVDVRHTSSGAFNTATTTTLTIGGVSASFASTTLLEPIAGVCGSAAVSLPLVATAPAPGTLCSFGAATAVTSSNTTYTWVCNGLNLGADSGTCTAGRGYTVTPVAGPNGSISPNTAQVVAYNATQAFSLTASASFFDISASGCGGSLSGNTFTTGPVTANCTVTASFTDNTPAPPAPPTPPIGGGSNPGTPVVVNGSGQTLVVNANAVGSPGTGTGTGSTGATPPAVLQLSGNANLQLPGGANLGVTSLNPASPAQITFVAGPGGVPVPQLVSGSISINVTTAGTALLGGLTNAAGQPLVLVADQVPIQVEVVVRPDGTVAYTTSGTLRIEVGPSAGRSTAARADTTPVLVHAGESARFNTQGRLTQVLLGSPEGNQGRVGDALALVPSPAITPAGRLQRQDYVPQLQGSPARLGRNLADALAAQLSTTGGFASASVGADSATLVTTAANGQRRVWQAKGRISIYLSAITSVAASALNQGASGQNDAQNAAHNPSIAGGWVQTLDGIVVRWAPALLAFDAMAQALAQAGGSLTVLPDGSYLVLLDNQHYSAQAGGALSSPGTAAPGFGTTPQGTLGFANPFGSQQAMHAAAADFAQLLRLLKAADATASAQADPAAGLAAFEATGQLRVELAGSTYTLVPDIALSPIPTAQQGKAYWLQGTRLFMALPGVPGMAQGFGVR